MGSPGQSLTSWAQVYAKQTLSNVCAVVNEGEEHVMAGFESDLLSDDINESSLAGNL